MNMSPESSKLERAMTMVKTEDADGHKQIYSFAVENMDPQGVPHIAALIYGADRILLPEMHWESAPDLLDVFALAEAIRQQTVADAKEALLWDRFYRKGGDLEMDGSHLIDEERKTLKSIAKKTSGDIYRETYRTVVMQVCWAHIHRLRRSSETFLIPLIFRRYFPAVDDLKKSESQGKCALWHRGISGGELVAYEATRAKVIEFLQDAELWEERYFSDLPHAGKDSRAIRMTPQFQADFCNRFPLIVGWDTLAGILRRHLTKIQNMVSKLHSVFPDEGLSDAEEHHDRDGRNVSTSTTPQHGSRVSSTHPFSRQGDPEIRKAAGEENKKDSQDSNVSSKLSYVDVPQDFPGAPPTSLLHGGGE